MTKLWLDDTRDPYEFLPRQFPDRIWNEETFGDWVWVKTVPEAMAAFEAGGIDEASFDPVAPEPDGTWKHFGTPDMVGVWRRGRLDTARFCSGTSRLRLTSVPT